MAGKRQFVLRCARDVPLLDHQLTVFAHGKAGPSLVDVWNRDGKQGRSKLRQQTESVGFPPRTSDPQQQLPERLPNGTSRVPGRINAAGNPRLDLPAAVL